MPESPYQDWLKEWADGATRSAREIVPIAIDFVEPTSVVDVGCGVGAWLSVFAEFGVSDYIGVDGEYIRDDELLIPSERFLREDLTTGTISIDRRFGLAVCLEVAEHLPVGAADTLVRTLTELAPVVMFSAAIPGQRGLDHVNEQWPTYWAARFRKHGYEPVDAIRSLIWENSSVEPWYRQNLLFFADATSRERLVERQLATVTPSPLSIVHPEMFIGALTAAYYPKTTRELLKLLPAALVRSVKYRLRRDAEGVAREAEGDPG